MQHADKGEIALDGKGLRIGIVQARFNEDITDALAQACRGELALLGVADEDIDHLRVPGALEVPLVLQALAERNRYDALVALGCIVRGETYHFELVANESGASVSRVALDYRIPIANAIKSDTGGIVGQAVNAKVNAACINGALLRAEGGRNGECR